MLSKIEADLDSNRLISPKILIDYQLMRRVLWFREAEDKVGYEQMQIQVCMRIKS